ncbi:uncharacterized protein AB675_2732 [Cyphellophora attinorum]|uniref:Glycosyl transferase family 25 domain-containing protein n=1 Tax=Cyphellophora attinorum TaxID=1664694 RepID=A0A0N1HXI7_9EURO|nr:uncharacterized protein AB675_2732 [Phialophora attinorum]KPI45272.1 hypothetical protein AB675_2732 [Phialophora attinorum]
MHRPIWQYALVALLVWLCLLYLVVTHDVAPLQHVHPLDDDHIISKIQNSTLGFQEISVISLPERTDKRDAWTIMSSLFDLDIGLADGVDGAAVSEKALPHTFHQAPGIVGCWRAHMNVLQDIVNRNVASALVFEDDADWDVSIRDQLVQFGRGARWLQNTTDDINNVDSPYGTEWDILWLGNCAAKADHWDDRRFVLENDTTADPSELRSYGIGPGTMYWPGSHTRLVFSQSYGVCTTAYAVSQSGARKMLYHLGLQPFNAPLDLALSDMCKNKSSAFNCIGVWPPLIGVYRAAGRWSSDIEAGGGGEVAVAHAERIVYSARMNVERLLRGDDRFVAANPGFSETELTMDEISAAIGRPERLSETNFKWEQGH